jgi:basic membrane lipoprotein Med (substrate-binding protein (PBP1-ABC) superfamily)/class 3 adenylate cyclase
MGGGDGTEEGQGTKPGAGLRTFLIADVRGYTRFTEERGDEEAVKLAARFAELARRGITDHGGELVELRGDEALGVFASAREALRAAVELQRLFRSSTDGEPGLPLGVGIGVDAGEAVPVEGGYRGGALNLAARLCSRAAPGEILASETVISLARRVEGIRLHERGTVRVKGLEEAVRIIEVVPESRLPPLPRARLALLRRFRRRNLTRRNAVAAVLIVLTAGASAAVFAVGAHPGATPNAAAATRVGLVLPRDPTGSDDLFAPYVDGLLQAERLHGVHTETLVVDRSERSLPNSVRKKLGDFDLVFLAGPALQGLFSKEVSRNPDTRFVFLDPHPGFDFKELNRLPNETNIFFIEGPASYLAGYLGALMEKRQANGTGRQVVSVVAGNKVVNENLVKGFVLGARAAVPGVKVLTDYSGNYSDPSVCRTIANRQMDRGSRVVFAAAGECSLGALSATAIRGAWGIGVDIDRSYLGPHILVSVVKRVDRAVEYAVRSFLEGTLVDDDLDIGIERDAVGIVGINPEVPSDIRRKVAKETELHQKEWASWATH